MKRQDLEMIYLAEKQLIESIRLTINEIENRSKAKYDEQKVEQEQEQEQVIEPAQEPVKRGRGRPKKNKEPKIKGIMGRPKTTVLECKTCKLINDGSIKFTLSRCNPCHNLKKKTEYYLNDYHKQRWLEKRIGMTKQKTGPKPKQNNDIIISEI